jgi:hypothetical protein
LETLSEQDDLPLRLELLTQFARAQALQRHFQETHTTLDAVEARLHESPPRVRVRYLLSLRRKRVHREAR